MKRIILYTLTLTLFLSPVFAKEKNFPQPRRVVNLAQLDPELIEELLLGMHPDIAIECKEGSKFPVQFLHNYGLFSLKCTPNLSIKVERPCYLRFVKRKVYISEDLAKWEKPSKFFSGGYKAKVKIDGESGLSVETKLIPYD